RGECARLTVRPRPSVLLSSAHTLEQVDEREDHDPDDVDEVPVEPAQLDGEALAPRQPARERRRRQGEQPDHTDGDVSPVEADQRVERLAEEVRLKGEALAIEVRELVALAAEEDQAERSGSQEPPAAGALAAALDRGQGEDHEQAAREQDEGAE